ncbi:MAG TPA: sigma-54-dependent Fis family transcriptional regulator [Gammaproteobacteria bacterium]|nr:sigma-54-dependent Fis family transcriptional regulator [Gammaproteobacteria bacterium]
MLLSKIGPQEQAEFLNRVWQEACRHIEIEEFAQTVAGLIAEASSLRELAIYELNEGSRVLTRIARAVPRREIGYSIDRSRCSPERTAAIARWAGMAQLSDYARLESAQPAVAGGLAVRSPSTIVGGLKSPHGIVGLVAFEPSDEDGFDEAVQALFSKLLDPIGTALENNHRLRTLGEQAKHAEQEKEGLLAKLGRTEGREPVIGADGGLRAVFARIERVCESDLPILILGETGSGKEVLAREIHQRSPRADGPFIRVNCGAIAPELIDSELFGHEKGSFTGATSQRRGWFERAHGGSLFLDEVGELPLAAQVRLLRILQDGVLSRVGGETDFKVDVRVIAATHRDLPAMIQDGRFREDLWYRLATFPVVLPPLRERPQDIAALAGHFARRAAKRFGLKLCLPSAGDLLLLSNYAWPGNVRELAAVIDRAAILGGGERLEIATALGAGVGPSTRVASPAEVRTGAPRPRKTQEEDGFPTLDEAMRQHISAALARTHGRIDGPHGAARILDINPHTLRARMRKLGVDWSQFKARPEA